MFAVKLCLVVVLVVVVLVESRPDDKYTTKYDNVDYDAIVKSDRLLDNYVKCLLDKIPCSPDGAELKRNLPDALQNDCSKCSNAQKVGSKKIVDHLIQNKNDWFKQLEAKYDPKGVYLTKYNAGN